MRMSRFSLLLAPLALVVVARGSHAQSDAAAADDPFPVSTALEEGVSPDALASLSELIQSFVDDDEIVGGELLVLKNGRTLLHEGYGWRNREAEVAMEPGSVFCVRSMTKPVIATAILMLIDDDQLELDERASKFLPSFDVDGLREITIEQLLTHTSGLPMSQIMAADLVEIQAQGGIRAVADRVDVDSLRFESGTDLSYSDQGTDTLTAIIEIVAGVSAQEFVETRVLDPLGMRESACVMTPDHPLRVRGVSKYSGSRGNWNSFWDTSKPPLFPFFLGSQGLYSTLVDYARFMELWERRGRAGKERLLPARLVRKALTPSAFPLGGATGLPGLRADYGYLMQLWTGPGPEGKEDEREVVAFGHTGSDGTYAWVFPDQNAMVLYFTQSRSNTTGMRVEESLGNLFLGVPFDANQAAPPFEEYLGYYRENEADMYRAIIRDGDDLALEILAKGIVPLSYIGDDRWKMRPNPNVVLAFDRSESGDVTGYHIDDHVEYRFEPSAELPSAENLAKRVADVHRIDLLESLGPMRSTAQLSIPKIGIDGETVTLTAWPDRFRVDSIAGDQAESYASDGEHVWYTSATTPLVELEGERAAALRDDHYFALFGDWHRFYPTLRVIQKIERNAIGEVYLVRAGDTSAPAKTLYVQVESGRCVGADSVIFIEGMGRLGQRVFLDDFRDVSGMLLPYKSASQLANPMIGVIETTVQEFELGVEVPEGTFELKD